MFQVVWKWEHSAANNTQTKRWRLTPLDRGWEEVEFPKINTSPSSLCFFQSCFMLHQGGSFWLHMYVPVGELLPCDPQSFKHNTWTDLRYSRSDEGRTRRRNQFSWREALPLIPKLLMSLFWGGVWQDQSISLSYFACFLQDNFSTSLLF